MTSTRESNETMTADERHVQRQAALHVVPSSPSTASIRRPLVRELEDVVERMHEHGPTARLRSDLAALLGAWASALVDLHRVRVPISDAPPVLPWVLDDGLPAWLDEIAPEAGPVWAVRAHPGIAQAVDRTRAGWSAVQNTHGDPNGDVVVVEREHGFVRAYLDSPDGSPCRGVLGDPRWDVATVADWLAVALGPALDPRWGIDPAATFVSRYRAHGGDALPSRHLAVARTLTTAVEWTAQLAVLSVPDDEALAWLSGLWSRPLALLGVATGARSGQSRAGAVPRTALAGSPLA
ncbi:serine/threonine-protein kinase [Cellulomonas rhizosphaerae]|uniref:Aminoglycoside phosphotransferase domain-containing protein n=1 Tax=Cellulomonas rhizosphaerae TaxID=2293719 RepID=A0A413RP62_9CELL|nr:hypothetical protein [Cellulomonas rhizosphaerae]RHA43735.1 hypothetical protein D1825_04815 [Cellulomonas rhizosphaerae]